MTIEVRTQFHSGFELKIEKVCFAGAQFHWLGSGSYTYRVFWTVHAAQVDLKKHTGLGGESKLSREELGCQ